MKIKTKEMKKTVRIEIIQRGENHENTRNTNQ